jgi:hypothetical protein
MKSRLIACGLLATLCLVTAGGVSLIRVGADVGDLQEREAPGAGGGRRRAGRGDET